MSILDQIVANKRAEIAGRTRRLPQWALEGDARCTASPPPFAAALRSAPMGLIAEVKRRSPSAGAIREPFDATQIAGAYERAGAQAVSVLIDERFFGGGQDVLQAVALPILYKEFVVDVWQIWHARRWGASAVLLIAGVLDTAELAAFIRVAGEAGLEALVEVHDKGQMEMAIDAGAACIGVNNRDLTTFQVSLDTSEQLRAAAPDGCTLISESGIRNAADVHRLAVAGFDAVLVGEHLLRQPDPERAVRDLMRRAWAYS
jgi:indole-3-glycerol phosphate synthase